MSQARNWSFSGQTPDLKMLSGRLALKLVHYRVVTEPTVATEPVAPNLIHFGQWPVAQGSGTGSHLYPPEGFPDKGIQWISFPLKSDEVETKRKAILEYQSQMLLMRRFLMSFAGSNELYMLDK